MLYVCIYVCVYVCILQALGFFLALSVILTRMCILVEIVSASVGLRLSEVYTIYRVRVRAVSGGSICLYATCSNQREHYPYGPPHQQIDGPSFEFFSLSLSHSCFFYHPPTPSIYLGLQDVLSTRLLLLLLLAPALDRPNHESTCLLGPM